MKMTESVRPITRHKSKPGLSRVWRAFFYSMDGLKAVYQSESAFRQELMLAAVLVPAALLLPVSLAQKALLVSSVLLILIVELLNSGLEYAVDLASLEDSELAKRAKDISSAAVLLSLVNCGVVWLLVLLGMLW